MSDTQPKRLIIKDAIEAGGATKESLMEAAECSAASLATNFTYLRLMGFYPVKAEDETFSFVTEEEWEVIQDERKANAKVRKTTSPKTPEQVLEMAEKRYKRCIKALATATEKAEQFDNEITDLRLTIASAEARLAKIVLDQAQAALPETDEDDIETDEDDIEIEEEVAELEDSLV